ncbi:MAG: hypothetical protein MUF22_00940 [Chitinispirillaceae bacterium]|jgi:V/A-type H+-transporting ATPase subunit E|nr:hypothetical protein [Chitinispirillaceae bacterium]
MDSKIAELTEKMFKEGVEKGTKKADEIVRDAETRAEKMVAEARDEAARIVADATKKAEELRTAVQVELKHSSQQALAALKQRIIDLVTATTVSVPMTKTLGDPAVLRELIATVASNFKTGGQAPSLEIILPAVRRAELENAFKADALKTLAAGSTLSFSPAFKAGFQIKSVGESFKISVTDEDFSEFFKEYLRPRAKAFLFGE